MTDTCGIILAGGLARRMGGGDKAMKLIVGTSILSRVITTLTPQCKALVLNANGDLTRFSTFGLPVVADDVPGFAGPLAGILAGLDHVAATLPSCTYALSVAADTPFLPADLVARLHAARLRDNKPLAVAVSNGQTHPVIGLWPVAIRRDLRKALVEEDERKIDRFTSRFGVAEAAFETTAYDPFFNVNTLEDLAEAEMIAKTRITP